MSRSTVLPHRKVVQARALLLAADGVANEQIARRCEVDSDTVRRWRARFAQAGPAGVGVIAKGRGRKPSLPPGSVAEVLRVTQHERPADGATHWTIRSLAARVGIGKDAVARIWADHNLKPWRVDTFKISNDPRFEDKLVDVVGLYLNPPANRRAGRATAGLAGPRWKPCSLRGRRRSLVAGPPRESPETARPEADRAAGRAGPPL